MDEKSIKPKTSEATKGTLDITNDLLGYQGKEQSFDVGVIVGRFQVDELTIGHRNLIDHVDKVSSKLIIYLGVSCVPFTYHNPLDYVTREIMIRKQYPKAVILPLKDVGNNKLWSTNLDNSIRTIFPTGTVMLFGSRSSFIDSYEGGFYTSALEPEVLVTATGRRKEISNDIRGSKDFRRGIIYAASNRFFNGISVIDVAAFSQDESEMLLGRKRDQSKYRFIGGFVDVAVDSNMTDTVMREFREETGSGIITNVQYVMDIVTDDWRYRYEKDKILTALFRGTYESGVLEASDDIVELRWFKVAKLKEIKYLYENVVYPHAIMMKTLLNI